ncbi:hypothetical protein I4641_16735 [Waterburya agarophytonicola K14]|uniref:Uncharacterized protein n=1 Tax=Waterburya agarophytonicola KI4 TaxID=2874699 RepID=A0A964BUW1_9CYAN|nr:hypothetical protein [Waterburya agarophytonicola]MCC0178621.1 hypothetical protein [Waterburya agarophytonicola KI4]
MSKQDWAAIVYGRSYHLDFRFITIPYDFTAKEIAWVLPYIIATTQKARNLSTYPRWSLFKNNSHCVVGVTCMVRDLIGRLGEDLIEVMAKDDRGRPLYVFVGYVTKLNRNRKLIEYPAYTGNYLTSFKPLYQEIEKVWLARDYDDRKPCLSEYKALNNTMETIDNSFYIHQISRFNHQTKYPEKTFVWQNLTPKNYQLWLASSQCVESTSVCLDIQGKYLIDSPFLNQTVSDAENFAVCQRINRQEEISLKASKNNKSLSFKEKISTKAKEDIDLTLQQAAKVTSASQEIIGNLTYRSNSGKNTLEKPNSSRKERDNFGFKVKKNPLPSKKQDWF